MKIHEYQARDLFAAAGIPVPPAQVATTPVEAKAIAAELGVPVVVKAQVLTGGRGKAGGVKLAANPDEAESAARDILGIDISGFKVDKVLVRWPPTSPKRSISEPSSTAKPSAFY